MVKVTQGVECSCHIIFVKIYSRNVVDIRKAELSIDSMGLG